MAWLLVWSVAVMAAVTASVVIYRRDRFVFIIELSTEGATVRQGSPPAAYVRASGEVARLQRIPQGRIQGVRQGNGVVLRFSRDMPERVRQPLRNCWSSDPPPTSPTSPGRFRRAGS